MPRFLKNVRTNSSHASEQRHIKGSILLWIQSSMAGEIVDTVERLGRTGNAWHNIYKADTKFKTRRPNSTWKGWPQQPWHSPATRRMWGRPWDVDVSVKPRQTPVSPLLPSDGVRNPYSGLSPSPAISGRSRATWMVGYCLPASTDTIIFTFSEEPSQL